MSYDFQAAVRQYQSGDFNGALKTCTALLLKTPNGLEPQHLSALCLAQIGRFSDAGALFERVAQRHASPAQVWADYGSVLRSAGRIGEAIEVFRRAVLTDATAKNALNGLAMACHENNDTEEAKKVLMRLIDAHPMDAGGLNNLGVLLNITNNFDEALKYFDRAIKANPKLISAYINRGKTRRELGLWADAIRDGEKSVTLNKNNVEAHYQLAVSFLAAGDRDQSSNSFRNALVLAPSRGDIHEDFARALWASGAGAASFAALDHAIAQTREPTLILLRGGLAFNAGDLSYARQCARQVLDGGLAPERRKLIAAAKVLLARLSREAGEIEAAVEYARAGVELDPANYEHLHHCCELEMASGQFEAAAARLQAEAPHAFAQRHIALRCLALRATGKSDYRYWYDYDRFVQEMVIDVPSGFGDLDSFNQALAARITALHNSSTQPIDQTLFGGTQSIGALWQTPDPVIQAFVAAMKTATQLYIDALPDDQHHPFLVAKTHQHFRAGSWSVMLKSGGGHVDHIHPMGWISASYYVQVPIEIDGANKAGHLRLGASGVRGVELAGERWIKPTPGKVVFFPSYIWHGVEPFKSGSIRIAAPFDMGAKPPQ